MKQTTKKKLVSLLTVVGLSVFGAAFLGNTETQSTYVIPETPTGSSATVIVGKADLKSFAMQYGASVRTDSPAGIRFISEISTAELSELPSSATFGTLIIPEAILDGNELTRETAQVLDIKAKTWKEASQSVCEFTGVLIGDNNNNFLEKYYDTQLVARSYVTYTDGEGETQTVYTQQSDPRSIAWVASRELVETTGTPNQFLVDIVDSVMTGKTLSVTTAKTLINKGDTVAIAAADNQGLDVKYESTNPSVLTVDAEKKTVTAVASGRATLKATLGSQTVEIPITSVVPLSHSKTMEAMTIAASDGKVQADDSIDSVSFTHSGDTFFITEFTGKNAPNFAVGAQNVLSAVTATGNTEWIGAGVTLWNSYVGNRWGCLYVTRGFHGSNGSPDSIFEIGGASGKGPGLYYFDVSKHYVMIVGYEATPSETQPYAAKVACKIFEVDATGTLTLVQDLSKTVTPMTHVSNGANAVIYPNVEIPGSTVDPSSITFRYEAPASTLAELINGLNDECSWKAQLKTLCNIA